MALFLYTLRISLFDLAKEEFPYSFSHTLNKYDPENEPVIHDNPTTRDRNAIKVQKRVACF